MPVLESDQNKMTEIQNKAQKQIGGQNEIDR